jgi:hypothetical protein
MLVAGAPPVAVGTVSEVDRPNFPIRKVFSYEAYSGTHTGKVSIVEESRFSTCIVIQPASLEMPIKANREMVPQ